MNQILIGLCGPNLRVNTAVAHHLQEQHGLIVVRIAARFEEAIAAMIGRTPQYVADPTYFALPLLQTLPRSNGLHDSSPTTRSAVYDMRCGFADSLHRDFIPCLMEQLLQDLAATHSDAAGFVVSDLIFSNEGDFIRSHSGTVIHLDSDGSEARGSWNHHARLPTRKHASDMTITYRGTMRDVLMTVDATVDSLRTAQHLGADE